jgi:hypothetical protein
VIGPVNFAQNKSGRGFALQALYAADQVGQVVGPLHEEPQAAAAHPAQLGRPLWLDASQKACREPKKLLSN